MKTNLLLIVLFFSFTNVFGYTQLRVGDPRNSWQTYQGTIEEAGLTVTPKGLYMEYGLFLTFSSRNTIWTSVNDTLEVTLNFDLPENAMITDSWLWFGEDTIKALILDRWTASSIYESIVQRRRDPSVLYKQSATQYELRVFPMAGNETRKVKITYLVPVTWSKTSISAGLPLPILKSSNTLPQKLTVNTWEGKLWQNPVITGGENHAFENVREENYRVCKMVEIPSSEFNSNLKITFDTPLNNGYFFSKYETADEGYYQLAISPSAFLDSASPRKVAILVDYDIANTDLTSSELLEILKDEMQNNLNPVDSFNLIYSNLSIKKHSENWVAATSTNIDSAFHLLDEQLSGYSNLAALLANGIEFVNGQGTDGKIMLVSNSNQYTNHLTANQLIEDIMGLMNPKIPIYITDYLSLNYWYYYTNNATYYGNGYLYSNLAKLTSGSYQNMINGTTESDMFNQAFMYLQGSVNSFDLHTTLENGFCFSRYNLNKNASVVYLNEMVLQVGKFKGEMPFEIEFSGEHNNEIFSENIIIPDSAIAENDSVIKKIWSGTFIREMEKNYTSNDIVGEIISESMSNRILSLYTSFLCIEDTTKWCTTCLPDQARNNDDVFTSIDNFGKTADTISVYPNPFKDNLSIDVELSESGVVDDLSVYDLKGALIYKFDKNEFEAGSRKTVTWNGQTQNGSTLKPGIYLLVLKTATTRKTIKLVKQ